MGFGLFDTIANAVVNSTLTVTSTLELPVHAATDVLSVPIDVLSGVNKDLTLAQRFKSTIEGANLIKENATNLVTNSAPQTNQSRGLL
jgi:hypothetical protein